MDLEKIVFLDFETDTEGNFFCASFQQGRIFEQVILNEKLRPLADEKELRCLSPKAYISEIIDLVRNSILAAYTEAELNTIRNIFGEKGQKPLTIKYCNMKTATMKYINTDPDRCKIFADLPPFVLGANNYQQRRMRRSLGSVARMFPVKIPAAYHPGQTSKRFKHVLKGLHVQNGDFSSLTRTQKAKATKALNHNKFDVEVLPVMFKKVLANNPKHITRSTEIVTF